MSVQLSESDFMSKIGNFLKEGKVVDLVGIGFLFVVTRKARSAISPFSKKEYFSPAAPQLRIVSGYVNSSPEFSSSTEELRKMLETAGFEIVSVEVPITIEKVKADSNITREEINFGDSIGSVIIKHPVKTSDDIVISVTSEGDKLEKIGIKGFVEVVTNYDEFPDKYPDQDYSGDALKIIRFEKV